MELQSIEHDLSAEKEKIIVQVEREEVAVSSFASFIRKMRSKYSENDFPDEESVNRISPYNNDEYSGPSESMVAYEASINFETVGIIIGESRGKTLVGKWYFIDPEYQNSEVREKLIEAIGRDYRRVTLLAIAQVKPGTAGDNEKDLDKLRDRKTSRQQALIRYYERLGFKCDTNSELYGHHREPWMPMPMVIELEDQKN